MFPDPDIYSYVDSDFRLCFYLWTVLTILTTSRADVTAPRLSPGPAVLWAASHSGPPDPGPPPPPPGWRRLLPRWGPASQRTPRFGPAASRAASRPPAACTSHRDTRPESCSTRGATRQRPFVSKGDVTNPRWRKQQQFEKSYTAFPHNRSREKG